MAPAARTARITRDRLHRLLNSGSFAAISSFMEIALPPFREMSENSYAQIVARFVFYSRMLKDLDLGFVLYCGRELRGEIFEALHGCRTDIEIRAIFEDGGTKRFAVARRSKTKLRY